MVFMNRLGQRFVLVENLLNRYKRLFERRDVSRIYRTLLNDLLGTRMDGGIEDAARSLKYLLDLQLEGLESATT